MARSKVTKYEREVKIFRDNGGVLSTMKAVRLGVHPVHLYAMRDTKVLEQLDRGVYRLASMPLMTNPGVATVMSRTPGGVLCLISALSFHEITTQIPHEIYVAIKRGTWAPRIEYPPVRMFRFSGKAYSEGIEERVIDGVKVRVYDAEKTLTDCFKCRNVVGLDTALEALRTYWRRGRTKIDKITRYSRICRVEKVMRPYLEAVQ